MTRSTSLDIKHYTNDKDSAVQEQVRKSMLTLGKQQPDRVLAMCQDYLLKHPKVKRPRIPLQYVNTLPQIGHMELIKRIIALASDEMTRSKEVIPDWQQAASNILVAVGNKHINDIMEEILNKFQPGVLPHFFVVQTLANLSESNVYGMVPFLNAILGTMLPMLSMAKQDNMKWVFSSALCHFSDSILEYLANLDKAPDPTVRKDTFSSEIYAAFEILFNNWLQSRESKLRLTVAEAVGSMCHLMASDKLEEQIPKLIPAVLSLYKKNNEHYIISKSLCQVLDASVNMGSRVLETQLDSLFLALHQQVSAPTDYNNPPTVKNHNEVLRCFSLLANSFPDRLVMFVLQKLENSNERSRMGSLAVLRHLINSSSEESKTHTHTHTHRLNNTTLSWLNAMAHHGYLELEGGELLVRFIVQHCALHDTNQRGERQSDPEEVTNEALRAMCDSTLHLLTTTVGRLADVLWPKLLYYLTPSQFSNATTPLCKSLVVLGNKKKSNQEPSFNINFTQEGWRSIFTDEVTCHFLYQCIGVTLQQCFNKEVVKKQLQEVLLTARHSDAVEREGVAIGIGLCANSHLEGTLAKLDEFGKSDAFKKSPSIFNLLKERNDVEVEKVKSTLILCYGQVALNAPPEKILNRIDQDILRCISKHFNTKNMVSFHNLGALLGRLSPRCSDPQPAVRTAAINSIYTLLYIQLRYEGFSLDYKDEAVDSLLPLRDRLENPDHSVLYKTCSDLTKVMSKRLPQQQMTTLVFMLFEGLADSQTNCCRASSVILNTLLKSRGGGLQELVRVAVGQTVLILASQHLQTVFNTLVNQPLPYDSWTSEMWMALGADPIVANQIIEMVMEKLVIMAPYVDKKEYVMRGGTTKVATNQPLAMTCGLKELLLNGQTQEPAVALFPQLFSCLTVRIGASVGVSAPKDHNNKYIASIHVAGWGSCTHNFCKCLILGVGVIVWSDLLLFWEPNTHVTGVTLLARAMAKHAGPRLPAIVECLCPSLNNIYECQRITVTAFFSELLNHHVVTELMLIDVLMNNMMERISDPNCTVRMLAVRGLGNIAQGSPEKVQQTHIHGSAHSFILVSELFKDQIHNVLVSLLLHLVDPNPHVVKACKFAMRVCAPVVGSEQITTMFQNHLHDDKSLHYGEFINDLTKYLIQDFPGMLNFYHISVIQFFKSNWPEVRAGAAMFIGMTATPTYI
uniref:Maestro heat-like repeat-containing protein family member 1 n=1 Tax=Scophthalmus maximus TaxID=52904 RepID=A0A8D3DPJ7_SCOMX